MKNYLNFWCIIIGINYLWNSISAYTKYEGDECELDNGNLGICTAFINCTWAINGLKERNILYSEIAKHRCSFMDTTEIICCIDEGPMKPSPTVSDENIIDKIKMKNNTDSIFFPDEIDDDIPTRIDGRKIEIACLDYFEKYHDNITISFNILGGKTVTPGEFPHMVSIGYESQEFGNNSYNFNCGGTIINEYFILTAAHCANKRSEPKIVRMGIIDLIDNEFEKPTDREISDIIRHPLYTTKQKYNDIALLRLKQPMEFNNLIRPACLRTNLSDIDTNIDLYVTGWGVSTVEKYTKSHLLLKTNLTSVPLEKCNKTLTDYGRSNGLPNGLFLGQLCAVDPNAKHDTCEGDSGGPIQMVDENGMSTVVGITSFGKFCGTALPSVYTRVAYYIDWIELTAWS